MVGGALSWSVRRVARNQRASRKVSEQTQEALTNLSAMTQAIKAGQNWPKGAGAPTITVKPQALKVKGLIGPNAHPLSHGFEPGAHHILVNDREQVAQAFSFTGAKIWALPAMARGQGDDREWKLRNTDTPPGLYETGAVYRDWERNPQPGRSHTAMAFGWVALDLIELEEQERRYGRAGMMVHGGGSGLGWPGAWAPLQGLTPTYGCIRMHNAHLQQRVLPLLKTGRLFWSVYQEA